MALKYHSSQELNKCGNFLSKDIYCAQKHVKFLWNYFGFFFCNSRTTKDIFLKLCDFSQMLIANISNSTFFCMDLSLWPWNPFPLRGLTEKYHKLTENVSFYGKSRYGNTLVKNLQKVSKNRPLHKI